MRKFVDSMYLDLTTLSLDSSGDAAAVVPVEYTEAPIKTQVRCMDLCDTTNHFKSFPMQQIY